MQELRRDLSNCARELSYDTHKRDLASTSKPSLIRRLSDKFYKELKEKRDKEEKEKMDEKKRKIKIDIATFDTRHKDLRRNFRLIGTSQDAKMRDEMELVEREIINVKVQFKILYLEDP
jgi:hypothetical protein